MTLTPLATAALALLMERPMHPYEMYQTLLQRREDRNLKVRPGSLYHTVDRLAENGLMEAVGTDRSGNRPERTTYDITETGRRLLRTHVTDMLATPAEEYPEFRLAIAEAHNLPASRVVELLTTRRGALADQLADVEDSLRAVEAKRLPRRFWLDADYAASVLRADIAWLDTMITDIAHERVSWTEPVPAHLKADI